MMTNLPTIWTTNELYPPDPTADLRELLRTVLTEDQDEDRRSLLRRALMPAERSALQQRSLVLQKWMEKSRHGRVVDVILEMTMGFGSQSQSADEMTAVATQYAMALRDFPLWAIKRGCDRFANGSVTAEEIGTKQRIDRAFRPSTAQVAVVVRALVRPLLLEQYRIGATLRGVVARPAETAEQRAATIARIDELKADYMRNIDVTHLEETERENRQRQQRLEETEKRNRLARIAEFKAAGVEPPKGDSASLSLLLKMGWTIEGPDGEKVLVRPKAEAPVETADA